MLTAPRVTSIYSAASPAMTRSARVDFVAGVYSTLRCFAVVFEALVFGQEQPDQPH